MTKTRFFPTLENYISTLTDEEHLISVERKQQLQSLSLHMKECLEMDSSAQLIVICTHNSRRSHFGDIWLKVAALYYGHKTIDTYSGGTESTAFNPRSVKALQNAGFEIQIAAAGNNPNYQISMGDKLPPRKMFSKRYDQAPNPIKNFAAIMVCDEAAEACPIVKGAAARFAIAYKDPKAFDNTPKEEEAYALRCRQIAREMFYAVKMIAVL